MKRRLKLFVWENVLVNYGPGIMFVLAHDVEGARGILAYIESLSPDENFFEWRAWWAGLDEEDRDMHACWYRVWLAIETEPRVIEEPEGWVIPGSD